jgi:hypothetical protein
MPPVDRLADLRPWFGAVHFKAFPGTHLDFCRFARGAGFGWVELKYEPWLDERAGLMASASEVQRYARDHELELSVHAAYDRGLNIAASDLHARREALRACHASLEYAAHIGARYLTVHGGHLEQGGRTDDAALAATHEDVVATGFPPPALVERSLAALSELAHSAGQLGVVVSVENRHQFTHDKRRFPVTPQEVCECLDALPAGAMCHRPPLPRRAVHGLDQLQRPPPLGERAERARHRPHHRRGSA